LFWSVGGAAQDAAEIELWQHLETSFMPPERITFWLANPQRALETADTVLDLSLGLAVGLQLGVADGAGRSACLYHWRSYRGNPDCRLLGLS
jgi:hypothetical protein